MNNLLALLNGYPPEKMPIWLMRQAGRYLPEYRELRQQASDFMDFCYRPDLAIEATLQPIRRFKMDAAIIFSDILVIPDAMGQKVSFDEGPKLAPFDYYTLNFDVNKLVPVYETVRGVKQQLGDEVAVIGFAGAPWTLASYMLSGGKGVAHAKTEVQRIPREFDLLMTKLITAIAGHLVAQVTAGADLVQIFDSWAGELAYGDLIRLSRDPIRKIISIVKSVHPNVPVIVFPRRIGSAYKDYLGIGADVLSIDHSLPLDWVGRELQGKILLQGNMSPTALVRGGDFMRYEALKIVKQFGKTHIFNLGHGVLPNTPPEHVARLVDGIRGL